MRVCVICELCLQHLVHCSTCTPWSLWKITKVRILRGEQTGEMPAVGLGRTISWKTIPTWGRNILWAEMPEKCTPMWGDVKFVWLVLHSCSAVRTKTVSNFQIEAVMNIEISNMPFLLYHCFVVTFPLQIWLLSGEPFNNIWKHILHRGIQSLLLCLTI